MNRVMHRLWTEVADRWEIATSSPGDALDVAWDIVKVPPFLLVLAACYGVDWSFLWS